MQIDAPEKSAAVWETLSPRHRWRRRLTPALFVAVIAGAAAVGCQTNTRADTDGCEPGRTAECTCPNGQTGRQTCLAEGTSWGRCSCKSDAGMVDVSADADPGDTGTRDASEATWSRPSDDERTLVAKRLDASVAIDGKLDESAYRIAMRESLTPPSGESDNRLAISALWNDRRLVVGLEVRDDALDADESADIWKRDSVEVFVDGEHDGGSDQLDSDDVQMLIDAVGRTANRVGGPSGRSPSDEFEFSAATGETEDGYTVELAVPWDQMHLEPAKGLRTGFLFANNDAGGGSVVSYSWGDVSPFATPSKWGDLRLGGKRPGSDADIPPADTGSGHDAGMDAGTDSGRPDGGTQHSSLGCNILSDPPGSTVVDLGDKGLEEGDTIDPYLDQWVESGNEVHIPEGTYRWNGDGTSKSLEDLSIIGDGDVVWDTGGGHTWSANFMATGDVEIRNITVRGQAGDTPNKDGKIRFWAPDANATLVARNFNQPDGSTDGGRVGIFVPKSHAGEVYFVDCHIEGFGNNGIYGSAPGHGDMGEVHVIRGLFKNNNISNVRLGTDGSSARGVVSLQTDTSPDGDNGRNQRGVWIRERGDDIRLENVHAVQTVSRTSGAVLIQSRPGGGSGTLEDVRVRNDVSDPAVEIKTGDWSGSGLEMTGSNTEVRGGDFSDVCQGSSCQKPRTTPLPPCP